MASSAPRSSGPYDHLALEAKAEADKQLNSSKFPVAVPRQQLGDEPKYPKPKILAFDLPPSLVKQLRSVGYNAKAGTFGRPYKVKKGDGYRPIVAKASLPNYSEQEIVIIDLTPPETAEEGDGEKEISVGELDWYAKTSTGTIDPRPRAMVSCRMAFDRILKTGGVFVIFADARFQPDMLWAKVEQVFGGRQFTSKREIKHDNWSFLSVLSTDHLEAKSEYGTEIKVNEGLALFSSFLRRHLSNSTFSATLHPLFPLTKDGGGPVFFPLAMSKFNEPVAAVLYPRKNYEGFVLILPQLEDKEAAVLDLIQTVLPEIIPRLFPDHEGGRWVHREEYEHPSVLARKAAQLEAQRKANEEVARLDQEIIAERDGLGFLHGILTKSGDVLVTDVKRALEYAGFRRVVDVDEDAAAQSNKQEDLQILDRSPSLLLEVKGLAAMPTEGDTVQVTKYVLRRMKQWSRTDVQGLALINHQRNLPALERDQANVFTEPQVQDAVMNATGLFTTWDLFRLLRGKARWGWPDEAICDLLYRTGRVPPYPTHYTPVGAVAKYWTEQSAVSIEATDTLRVGDRVGYLLPSGFYEEQVTSLELHNTSVREIAAGQRGGHKTALDKAAVPVGTQVFRVDAVQKSSSNT